MSKGATSTRVLIVNDDLEMREALGMVLSRDGQTCELVASARAALEVIARQASDVVISDVRMPEMNGLELLDQVKSMRPTLPFIVITAVGAVPDAVGRMPG